MQLLICAIIWLEIGLSLSHSDESSEESSERGSRTPSPLQCDPRKSPVDIVFALDSSAAVGPNAFAAECASVMGMLHELNIGQLPGFSRIAFVNLGAKASVVSKLTKYHALGGLEAAEVDLMKLNYSSSRSIDVEGGLKAAEQLFDANLRFSPVPRIVVLFSSSSIDCTSSDQSSPACQQAKHLAGKGITLSTIALKFSDNREMNKLRMGQQRFSFYSDMSLMQNFRQLVCTAGTKGEPPRACACSVQNLWLDIVVVFDSSRGVDQGIFASQQSLVKSLLNEITISQKTGQRHSRIAFVNVADQGEQVGNLTSFKSNAEARSALTTIKHRNSASLNLASGLQVASKIFSRSDQRKNAPNVIILFSSQDIDCQKDSASLQANSPCPQASVLQDDEVIIITIGLTFDKRNAPKIAIGNEHFAIGNSENMAEEMIKMLCKANCHCPRRLRQVESLSGHKYGECVYLEEIPAGFQTARKSCMMQAMTMADVLDEHKEQFLFRTAQEAGYSEYFVGLEQIGGKYYWPAMKKLSGYTNFAFNEPLRPFDNPCTVVKQQFDTKQPKWFSAKCSFTQPIAYYFCQRQACDTSNYCEEN